MTDNPFKHWPLADLEKWECPLCRQVREAKKGLTLREYRKKAEESQ